MSAVTATSQRVIVHAHAIEEARLRRIREWRRLIMMMIFRVKNFHVNENKMRPWRHGIKTVSAVASMSCVRYRRRRLVGIEFVERRELLSKHKS